jgi:kynurenine 3-monooxygenase
MDQERFIIIGGGPVGLAAAILLAKEGHPCEVYEGRHEILNDYEQSYPIGINPRTLHTLSLISPELEEKAISSGIIINAWEIFAGSRRVAKQNSGTVYGTSRAKVNLLLYEIALEEKLIKINFNHKLINMNSETKELTFEVREKGEKQHILTQQITVKSSKVIAADGVNSKVRSFMDFNCPNFKSEIYPWTNEYRVLFSQPGMESPDLDPKVHYIFNSCYSATILNDNQQLWCLSLTARDSDDEETRKLLLSDDQSEDNKGKLLKYIKQNAPRMFPLFENNPTEIDKFFKRRSYRGAVVKCNKLNFDEWILLMGDSAHSLLPPTGEGINSGLEDVSVLINCLKVKGVNNLFSHYNSVRIRDLHGLTDYAIYLNEYPIFPGETASRIIFMIFSGCFKRRIFEELFGTEAVKRLPYSDITDSWKCKKLFILNLARIICIPIALVFFLIMPWRWGICCRKKTQAREMKPPIMDS